ncbi:maleate cis-trans isomerase family protein [Mameliella sediminis]|uniref:maleate cis-trans isomerase family protein n=1 Tax=Mameliella sediminis TaxID=2836866 RepID=UPI001C47376D|nr:aspartate/glutamate racemase family protein [Mameliella sediminis]MBV7396934.1 aspartate/glutamate racemase family protein [Mameliella sediminis]
MTSFPYQLVPLDRPTLALIALHTDETVENDFRRLFPASSASFHVTRVPAGAEVTPETLARMEIDLPRAVELLPPSAEYDAVAYGCTSGTTMIGVERVAELISSGCTTRAVCNPLSAAREACRALGLGRLGLVSPYRADVAQPVSDALTHGATKVVRAVHFGEAAEANVARISKASVIEAARAVARDGGIDGVFLSCTNLPTLDVIEDLERELDLPVFGSNLALAWAMARVTGKGLRPAGPYRLLAAC